MVWFDENERQEMRRNADGAEKEEEEEEEMEF